MMPNSRSARPQFPLLSVNITRLPAAQRNFRTEVVAGLASDDVEQAWRAKFKSALESITG